MSASNDGEVLLRGVDEEEEDDDDEAALFGTGDEENDDDGDDGNESGSNIMKDTINPSADKSTSENSIEDGSNLINANGGHSTGATMEVGGVAVAVADVAAAVSEAVSLAKKTLANGGNSDMKAVGEDNAGILQGGIKDANAGDINATLFGTGTNTEMDNGDRNVDDQEYQTIDQILKANPPPPPLPPNWFLRPSRTFPGNFYYFNQETGECRWDLLDNLTLMGDASNGNGILMENEDLGNALGANTGAADVTFGEDSINATAAAAAAAVKSILKRSGISSKTDSSLLRADGNPGHASNVSSSTNTAESSPAAPAKKKIRLDDTLSDHNRDHHRGERNNDREHHHRSNSASHSGTGSEPKEVRVLHILKKHRGSRRPASWRNPKITDSKEKAIADLRELISILKESRGDFKELRATFEELAKTESDCSSAKRGGDLGFFGRKKMQPAFEKASFGLKVGQLSDIVDTSSGVHVILRLA